MLVRSRTSDSSESSWKELVEVVEVDFTRPPNDEMARKAKRLGWLVRKLVMNLISSAVATQDR